MAKHSQGQGENSNSLSCYHLHNRVSFDQVSFDGSECRLSSQAMNIPFNDFYLSGTLPRPQGSDLMSGLLQPASEPTEIAVQNLEVMLSWTSAFPKSLTVPPHLAGRLAKHAQHAGLADGEAGLCHISINSRCVVGLILCWRGGVELEAEILAADQFSHRAAKSGCQM